MSVFRIKPADNFIWNLSELIDFLLANQQQHIRITNGTEGNCAARVGLYDWLDKFQFKSVTIETANVLEYHPSYRVVYNVPFKFFDVTETIEPEHHIWNQKAIFGTVYGRPLWHRLGLASYLLCNHAAVSRVGFTTNPNDIDQRELYELVDLWKYHPSGLVDFARIQNQLPVYHPEIAQYTPGAHLTDGYVAQSKQIYPNFLIDIVAETFTSGHCFFATEKTVRPMLLKKPFITFGSRNFLLHLRQMGFRTFGDFWDEDYDGYEGTDRYTRIIALIDHLAEIPIHQLEKIYLDMQYTLDHNYRLLMDGKFSRAVSALIK